MKKYAQDFALLLTYVTLVILTRTVFHIDSNVEFIIGTSLCAGYFFKHKKLSLLVPISSLVISDFIIGNSMIFIFTWTGFTIVPMIGAIIKKYFSPFSIQFGGIISTVIFFLWTNFGVVLTTSMYPKTIEGLGQSYINGLPFITNQLAGNLIIVPALFVFTYALININFKLKFDKVKNILIKPKF